MSYETVLAHIQDRVAREKQANIGIRLDCPRLLSARRKSSRAYAHVERRGPADSTVNPYVICVHPDIQKLPDTFIAGILWHELGHVFTPPCFKGNREVAADDIVQNDFGVILGYSDDAKELEFVVEDLREHRFEFVGGRRVKGLITVANQSARQRRKKG